MKMLGSEDYRIEYLSSVVKKDIPVLSHVLQKRVKLVIEEKLLNNPEIFGKPLKKSLKGFRSLRVGDYRIIYLIEKHVVLIVIIQHRSVAYKQAQNRIL